MEIKYPKQFPKEELMCKCGCGQMGFSQDFIDRLVELRVAFGNAMPLTSAYRCSQHNQEVSKTGAAGPHTLGAVDVAVSGEAAYTLVHLAYELGWTGIGLKQHGPLAGRYIHLDRCTKPGFPRPIIWTYP